MPLSKETAIPLLPLCKELPPLLGGDKIPLLADLKGDAGLGTILGESSINKLLRVADFKGSRRYTQFREGGGVPSSSEKFLEELQIADMCARRYHQQQGNKNKRLEQ
jgi:hypothetical protein